MLYGNQRLMYCGLLHPIHGNNLNPFAFRRKPLRWPHQPPPNKKSPACFEGGALSKRVQLSGCYFAGAPDESFIESAALWDFL
jgi:hypothetical protein